MRKRFIDNFLVFNTDSESGGSGTAGAASTDAPKGPEFPADTAVKDMTLEQQAAYWKHQSRKHEDRVKAFGSITPEQAAKAAEDIEEARKKGLSDVERAVEEARSKATSEVTAAAAKKEAETALKMALRGRTIDGSVAFDRPDFVKDGSADTEAIIEWVEANSQAAGGGRRHVDIGQGKRESLIVSGRESGRAEAEKRFGKKS